MTHNEDIDTFVRDVTKITPKAKSEVSRRLKALLTHAKIDELTHHPLNWARERNNTMWEDMVRDRIKELDGEPIDCSYKHLKGAEEASQTLMKASITPEPPCSCHCHVMKEQCTMWCRCIKNCIHCHPENFRDEPSIEESIENIRRWANNVRGAYRETLRDKIKAMKMDNLNQGTSYLYALDDCLTLLKKEND